MLCNSCDKLIIFHTNKNCVRCKSAVYNSISVLCNGCSAAEQQCAACLKKIVTSAQRAIKRGCNCGSK